MASNIWNWSVALSGFVLCKNCRSPLNYHGPSTDIWYHTELGLYCPPNLIPAPLLHNLNLADIVGMGYGHGAAGAELLDNPYYLHNPLHDLDDCSRSKEEADAWLRGWHKAVAKLAVEKAASHIPKELTKVILDGFDWLEQERD